MVKRRKSKDMGIKIEVSDEVINADVITLCNPLAVKKAVVIPENLTNGDIIKVLFPDYKIKIICFKDDNNEINSHPDW